MTVNASLINATLTEIEATIAVATQLIDTMASASYIVLQCTVFQQDTQTQQDFIAREQLHTLINTTLPSPGYW
ncbi:hypothetical protein [Paraburkholderia sp. BL10I2N1]|uniref:hypothetical protein n=1 Tax=Paraburkholderia sp. BL10I2N1 TaxID=1938796 RepID=UPI00105C5A08|nr:hypothetical protein [Paraburkholderia sp. BL10I2N1]TDN70410.1 hypothetical protein B0G77_3884 [Paraburkholderia sp. BL10I2N1]